VLNTAFSNATGVAVNAASKVQAFISRANRKGPLSTRLIPA